MTTETQHSEIVFLGERVIARHPDWPSLGFLAGYVSGTGRRGRDYFVTVTFDDQEMVDGEPQPIRRTFCTDAIEGSDDVRLESERRPFKPAEWLRRLAERGEYGHRRHPAYVHLFEDSYHSRRQGGELYFQGYGHRQLTDGEWRRLCAFTRRYQQFYRYMTEVRPGWQDDGGPCYYADNSIEQRQVCANGCHTRIVPIAAPGGDLCY